ncbi:hypothetical protein [Clostridium sp.]|uniref:hypothetical protein n=1 Tax=Clostridium sp. TaxID=1506 RepID=UPI00284E31DE|nr:hypothetical protein [Clostridium sp.]MDR3596454.1 hypothetical protein [Clostridium sp.]
MKNEITMQDYKKVLPKVEIYATNVWNDIINENQIEAYNSYRKLSKSRKDDWKTKHDCMFPGCLKKSISQSHSIQKAVLSKFIAENDHVYHFVCSDEPMNTKLEMKDVSINVASTFPGFCIKHESDFKFEKYRKIDTEDDFVLQIFRTVCRDLAEKKNTHDNLKKMYQKSKDKIYPKIKKKFENHLNKSMNEEMYEQLKKDFFYVNYEMKLLVERFKHEVTLYTKFYEEACKTLLKKEKRLIYKYLEVDVELPICLAGTVGVRKTENSEDGLFIFNILPNNNKLLICIATLEEYKDLMETFFDERTVNKLNILGMIESLMVYGTEQWYIKKSEWLKIDKDKRNIIMNDIVDCSHNFSEPYKFSIFDDLRKKYIEEYELNIDKELLDENSISEAIQNIYNIIIEKFGDREINDEIWDKYLDNNEDIKKYQENMKLYHIVELNKDILNKKANINEIKTIEEIIDKNRCSYLGCKANLKHEYYSKHAIYYNK